MNVTCDYYINVLALGLSELRPQANNQTTLELFFMNYGFFTSTCMFFAYLEKSKMAE